MLPSTRYVIISLLLLLVTSCTRPPNLENERRNGNTTQQPAADAETIAYGIQRYKELYCGTCHELTVANTAGRFGPTHNGFAAIAEQRIRNPDYEGTATTAAEYIRESIVDPNAYVVEEYVMTQYHMPGFSHLDEKEINALVQLLLAQE